MKRRVDGGAAAVEMAIILPLLLLILFGIIDFGRFLNAQISVSAAAREGARWAALGKAGVAARVAMAAPELRPAPVTTVVSSCPATATSTSIADVRVSVVIAPLTPIGAVSELFGGSMPASLVISGRGVMQCGG